MKQIILAATLVAVSASQASALSCIRPDVANAYQQASASDLTYVVLNGQFAFDPVPKSELPEPATAEATFSGRLLTSAGFTQQVAVNVTINMNCAGNWCAEVQPGLDYIAFVEQHPTRLIFEVSPCYDLAFKEPAIEDVKRLENCAQGGACAAQTE
ncbi:hypothetical protein N9M66_01345 [Litoreibacter sp.]|nr:hypothetical protein [Litoreibacter sp.]